ncbi:MAG: MFS transporter [Deltaproteobacteria bacterium]|nr:MAG: MFS transporter [Deltaproteobacteria bacterium]
MAEARSNLLYQLLKVRRGELSRTALHFFYLLNAVGAFILGRNVAAALFLKEYDAAKLPWMYVASAAAVSASSYFYSRISDRFRLDRLIAGSTLLLIGLLLLARLALYRGLPLTYPALYVLVEVMGSMLVIQFWTFANALHNTREAKRLFGVIGAGGVLANIVVGFGSAAIVRLVGTENLIYLMIANLAVCVMLVLVLGQRGQHQLVQAKASRSGSGKPSGRIALGAETARVFHSRHLRFIAAMVALTFIVTTLVDYQFKILAKQTYEKEELLAFFSLLYGFTGILALVIQLFVTGRLLERFGVIAALGVLPGALTLGSVGILAFPRALTAAVAKGADAVFRYTVNDATTQLLYLPVPAQNRLKAKAFIDGILKPVAYGSTGLLLALGVATFPGLNDRVHLLSFVTVSLGLAWLGLVFGIRKEYVRSLMETLRRRRLNLGESRMRIADTSTLEALERSLRSDDEREVLNALELLPHVEGKDWDSEVAELLDHPSATVRRRALEHLGVRASLQFGSRVFAHFEDPAEEVRAAAITTYCAIGKEKAVRAVQRYLDDPALPIRAAAIVGMIRYSGLDGVLAAAEALKSLLEHPSAEHRRHAAWVLGSIRVRNFYQSLLRLLGDPDVGVQLAAIEAAGKLGSPELVPSLIYKLANKATAAAAVSALAAFGDGIEDTLAKVLDQEYENPAVRRQIPRVLAKIGTQRAADILVRHLRAGDETLRQRLCHALNRVACRNPKLRLDLRAVESALTHELRAAYGVLRSAWDLGLSEDGSTADALLRRALDEKLDRTIERVFLLLGVLYPAKTIEVVATSIRSENAVVRANALELLDNTLSKRLGRMILPLVEDRPPSERLALGAELFGHRPRAPAETVAELLQDSNPWVVTCTLHFLTEAARPGLEPATDGAMTLHLTSTVPYVRETAARFLARRLPPAQARERIVRLAFDEHPQVRGVVESLLVELTRKSHATA